MNIKNEEDKAIRRTFSMSREVFSMFERQAKEKHLTNSGYFRYLVLREEDKTQLSKTDFEDKFCKLCGTQRCEGTDSKWFEGCRYKGFLKKENSNDR